MYRACLSCHRLVPATMNRHPECQREWDRARQAKRGDLYQGGWQRRARGQVAMEPWCAECGATTDLTADHLRPGVVDSPLRTLCRRCNSARANRMRARWGGGSAP